MHVLRPFIVILAVVAIILIARPFFIPDDFGVHDGGYMYGWHRQSNVEDWKKVTVKYQGRELCAACHAPEAKKVAASPHKIIECENCHGPANSHPADPPKLVLDKSRELCLRCHAKLLYPTSQRSQIPGINPEQHNPGIGCAICHNPHEASKPH